VPPYLEPALASVLSQTLAELELIVVDDGSSDRTPEILAAAAASDPRIRVLRGERRGVVAALNEGCGAASAPYLARLDADDIALPERLERQVALLDGRPDVGLVGGGYVVIDEAGRRRAQIRLPTTDEALRARLVNFNVFAHPATIFRREAFEQAGGYRLQEAEDYDLWLRISERWQLASVPGSVLEYRHHPGQVSLLRGREQALATLAARAAAGRRRAGAADPSTVSDRRRRGSWSAWEFPRRTSAARSRRTKSAGRQRWPSSETAQPQRPFSRRPPGPDHRSAHARYAPATCSGEARMALVRVAASAPPRCSRTRSRPTR